MSEQNQDFQPPQPQQPPQPPQPPQPQQPQQPQQSLQPLQPLQPLPQAAPPAAHPPPKSPSSALDVVLDLLVMVVLATAISLLVTKFAPRFMGSEEPTQGIAVIDIEELTREQVLAMGEAARAGTIEPEKMTALTQSFATELMGKLSAYSEQGIVVIKRSAVVSLPEAVPDLTQTIRDELLKEGVMLKRTSKE